jgi:hypothetical protein
VTVSTEINHRTKYSLGYFDIDCQMTIYTNDYEIPHSLLLLCIDKMTTRMDWTMKTVSQYSRGISTGHKNQPVKLDGG